jgi:predicted nucleic acid-binding protein
VSGPFFVDANAILYSALQGAGREPCLQVLEAVAAGEAQGRTSPAVLEEVWHVVQRRFPSQLEGLVESALTVFSPLLPVTEDALRFALELPESGLDANDRLHLGTCHSEGIEAVLTADRAFDGVPGVARIDPLDPVAVERLLAG